MPQTTRAIFGSDKALVGMIHLGPLPGSPEGCDSLQQVIDTACEEARLLTGAGFDSLVIENTNDRPYLMRENGPAVIAAMTAVGCAIRSDHAVPLGIQVLAGDNLGALAVAQACGGDFIRAEGFVFSSVADEGLMAEADAGPLLRARRAMGAEGIAIIADIKKKHSSHAMTADLDVEETARAAEYCRADGVVVTGSTTGRPVHPQDLEAARRGTSLPVIVGSGADPESVPSLLQTADAVIAGSWYKRDGDWRNEIDPKRLAAFAACRS